MRLWHPLALALFLSPAVAAQDVCSTGSAEAVLDGTRADVGSYLAAARAPDFDIEKLKAAMAGAAEIH